MTQEQAKKISHAKARLGDLSRVIEKMGDGEDLDIITERIDEIYGILNEVDTEETPLPTLEKVSVIEMVYKDTDGRADGDEIGDLPIGTGVLATSEKLNAKNLYDTLMDYTHKGKFPFSVEDLLIDASDVADFLEEARATYDDMPHCYCFARLTNPETGLPLEYELAYKAE